jgi:endonuclease/exonuclease/phosphatase family metal-dependent hydrolase
VVRIDHIFVKGDIQVVAAETTRTRLAVRASDHLPLVAELRIE